MASRASAWDLAATRSVQKRPKERSLSEFFKELIDRTGLSFFSLSLLCNLTALLRDNSHATRFTHLKYTVQWRVVYSQSSANTSTAPLLYSSSARLPKPPAVGTGVWRTGCASLPRDRRLALARFRHRCASPQNVLSSSHTVLWSAASELGAGPLAFVHSVLCWCPLFAEVHHRGSGASFALSESLRESWFLLDPLSYLKMRFCHWCLHAGRHAPSIEGFTIDLELGSGQET